MAVVASFQNMTPSLTPPPSDRGECEDSAIMATDAYLPEGFYPSPAPSFTHHKLPFVSHSPDMGHSDSTYDTEEDCQQMFFMDSQPQMFLTSTSIADAPLYSTAMSYPPFEQDSWSQYPQIPSSLPMYPYATENSMSGYEPYMNQVPSSIVPPMPQGVSSNSFNFNESMQRNSTMFTGFPNSNMRQTSPMDHSITSDGMSSRSPSPNSHKSAMRHTRRESILSNRSSSSSLHAYGIPIRSQDSSTVQAWRCAFPNCTSRAVFTRGCDLRKHYNRHSKHLFCRVDGCPQSEAACIAIAQRQAVQAGADINLANLAISGGFSSKKDRARHEAKHNPGIKCEWTGPNGEDCERLFSRMDNMKDHVRRIHNKGQPQQVQSSKSRRKTTGL